MRSSTLIALPLLLAFAPLATAQFPEFADQIVIPAPPLEPVPIPKELLPQAGDTIDKNGNPIYYQNAVRVLCYHDVGVNTFRPFGIDVFPDQFRDQIRALERLGYNIISTRELQDFLVDSVANPVPPNAVVITLDDFYLGNYEHAFPILVNEFGFPATFYAHTNFVGVAGPTTTNPKASWDNMREMLANSNGLFLFQSHTVNHLDLTTLATTNITNELVNSRNHLSTELSLPLSEFEQICYPYGAYNEEVIQIARDVAGYSFGYTTITGFNVSTTPHFEIRRDSIFADDTLQIFLNRLGYTGSDPDGPIIIDNPSAGFSSTNFDLVTASGSNQHYNYGSSYRRADPVTTGPATATATWTTTVPRSGEYEIFAWWPGNRPWDNNTIGSNVGATYTITQGVGLNASVVRNQSTPTRGQWNSLGNFTLNNSEPISVQLGNVVTSGTAVFADAIKLEFIAPTTVSDWESLH